MSSFFERVLYTGLLVLFLLHNKGNAQHQNVWVMGGRGIDFNLTPPQVFRASGSSEEANASICDENGKLLFYSDGSYIWDRDGALLDNGSNLTGIQTGYSFSATQSTSQGVVIVPFVGEKYKYYVFSLTAYVPFVPEVYGRLFVSVVDMKLNNGKGGVVNNLKGIALDSNLREQMVSVTGTRCNYWLLVCESSPEHKFKAYEINEHGIASKPVISNGNPVLYPSIIEGNICVAPDNKLLAQASFSAGRSKNGLALFDFEPSSGIVSNYRQLAPNNMGYGVCFSPDSRKLYFNSSLDIVQFDLSSPDLNSIIASGMSIYRHTQPEASTNMTGIKLAPNGKIYTHGGNTTQNPSHYYYARIDKPNLAGRACAFERDGLLSPYGDGGSLNFMTAAPTIISDTFYKSYAVEAPCFSNVWGVTIAANNRVSGWSYKWNTGAETDSVIITTPGRYWVTYYSPPCNFHSDTIEVSFSFGSLPTLIIDTACANAFNGAALAVTYPGDTVLYHYEWSDISANVLSRKERLQDVAGGTYQLKVMTAKCDTTLFINIPKVYYKVSFSADTLICQNADIFFKNTSSPHFKQFVWNLGNNLDVYDESPHHTYRSPGVYPVFMRGEGPICSDTATTTIIVDSMYSNDFALNKDSICVGETIIIHPQWNGNTLNFAQWKFEDDQLLFLEKVENLHHAFDKTGSFPITLTSHFRACPYQEFVDTLFVSALPLVDLGIDSVLCLGANSIVLSNLHVSDSLSYTYLWSSGDTTSSLVVRHPGHYKLEVRALPMNCLASETVTVRKGCYLDIPNVFTPNDDGYNDYFFPRSVLSSGVNSFYLQIFNRWGQVVFETRELQGRGWDGRFNGQPQPAGVYLYKMDFSYTNQEKEIWSGNVTLLR